MHRVKGGVPALFSCCRETSCWPQHQQTCSGFLLLVMQLPKENVAVYAIIRDRGMQYRVEQGQVLTIDLVAHAEAGAELELGEVLLVSDGEKVTVGSPLVSGAMVRAEVLDHVKGDKIVVFRYRNKKRYRRRTGHRQRYTQIKINEITI